ncbi:MAG: DUF4340 domain-containing protein [Saprospiraceae bacterium]|jgi:hypothetical protein|nr:DUF4340 domain-containing protein [Saprospiraceae bacterium]
MKRNLLLLLALTVLVALSWWFYQNGQKGSTLSDYEGAFAIEDTSIIAKIVVQDRKGGRLQLERQPNHWLVNSRFRAEPRIMKEMLETVSQLEVKFIPPASMVPNIIKSLASLGKRVDIYDNKGKTLKTYYVGGVTPDGTGTFCMMEGSNQPFVVSMKYFHGSVAVRFFLDEKDWKARNLFPLGDQEIVRYSLEYPKQREKSFTITQTEAGYNVEPFYDLTARNPGKLDEDIIRTYLSDIKKLKVEGFMNDHPDRDSLANQLPFCIITLETQDTATLIVAFHPMLTSDRKGNVMTDREGKLLPIERYHVSSNWGDLMMAQNEPFLKLFATYNLFFR